MIIPLTAFWPPWRFGSNIKNADETIPESLSEVAVVAEWCFATLVVLGVAAEFVIAKQHPAYGSWLGWWGPAYADLLVAIGVAGEVFASVVAHVCQNDLTRRSNDRVASATRGAGEANERAAKAEERTAELEKFVAGRRLSPGQMVGIIAAIEGQAAAIDLLVEFQNSDSEAFVLARDICLAFEKAGVKKIRCFANTYLSGVVFGLSVVASEGIDIAPLINVFAGSETPLHKTSKDLETHLSRNVLAPNLYIFVGPKPTPALAAELASITPRT